MGISKSNLFTNQQNMLANWAKALAHPARIAILEILAQAKGCACGELVDQLPLSQATISQHLKAMKEAGLIIGEGQGRKMCYCINEGACAKAGNALKMFFNCCNSSSCC